MNHEERRRTADKAASRAAMADTNAIAAGAATAQGNPEQSQNLRERADTDALISIAFSLAVLADGDVERTRATT